MKRITSTILAGVSLLALAPLAANAQSAGGSITCGQPYTVASGDTLSKIYSRAYGRSGFADLYRVNASTIGENPDLILIGQRLQIPCQLGRATAQVAPAAPEPTQVASTEASTVTETAPADAAVEPENLIFTFNKTSNPKFIINSGIIDLYLDEIAEVTDGRVQFIDPPVMNRDPKAQLDLVVSGAVDGTYIFNGHLGASHPLLQLPMQPLMGGSAEQTAVSLWRMHDAYLADTDYFDDAQLMGFLAAPAAHIWRLTSSPVFANQDVLNKNNYAIPYFEGLDTRGPKVVQEENAKMLARYDEPTNGSMTFFLAHGAARAAGLWNNTRTVTEIDNGVYTPTFSVVLSNEAWGQISPADQDAIAEISGERLAARSASWDVFDNGHRQHMLDTGLSIAKPSAAFSAELELVSAEGVDAWVKAANAIGVPGQEAVNAYKQTLESLQNRLVFR